MHVILTIVLTAECMGLSDRGVLREDATADIVVLYLEDVRDIARFGDPHHYATGARHVIVNGVLVLLDPASKGALTSQARARAENN